ncbi:hypothetical protein [Tunturibacter empetritectus]|uniref:Uncharacterized protein n=1 Tax=Tunturiibacter lichenicola TaxID=2051959 RepID=A0A7W8J733_9BACT|nr:hypothetical protein [Edaphobacter lichenicola]MBB5343753.1 hypothetical protein [Edaphobacter lichenicola]
MTDVTGQMKASSFTLHENLRPPREAWGRFDFDFAEDEKRVEMFA